MSSEQKISHTLGTGRLFRADDLPGLNPEENISLFAIYTVSLVCGLLDGSQVVSSEQNISHTFGIGRLSLVCRYADDLPSLNSEENISSSAIYMFPLLCGVSDGSQSVTCNQNLYQSLHLESSSFLCGSFCEVFVISSWQNVFHTQGIHWASRGYSFLFL